VKIWFSIGVIAAMTLLSGCISAGVVAYHEPMHPSNTEYVMFRAEASGEVDRVILAYERFELSTGAGGAHVQTLVDSLTTLNTCDPAGTVSTLTCTHTMTSTFPANSLIRFRATAVDGRGRSTTETYSFAAGEYPWPNDPIPIRTKGDPGAKLDVVLIPDTDITLASFVDQLDEVIEDLYLAYSDIENYRGLYNFYYSGFQGNYEELCVFTDPTNMANLTAIGDTIAILHQTDLRDCRSGNKMSSEIDYDKTLIHESGHALFGLQDEYCCDSNYAEQACVANIWNSLAGCEADATDISHPASNCTQLCDSATCINFWYIDPEGTDGCIMGDSQHNAGSDFGKACHRRIVWRYTKCMDGNCYPSPECP
jgi:hypothetical protein